MLPGGISPICTVEKKTTSSVLNRYYQYQYAGPAKTSHHTTAGEYPAQPLTAAGEEVDCLEHGLSVCPYVCLSGEGLSRRRHGTRRSGSHYYRGSGGAGGAGGGGGGGATMATTQGRIS